MVHPYGYKLGDNIETLLELTPELQPHLNAWANTDGLTDEAKEHASALGIRLSGVSKRQAGTVKIGDDFSIWLCYDITTFEPSVVANGLKRVNKAMTIIEWMLGELVLPIPGATPKKLRWFLERRVGGVLPVLQFLKTSPSPADDGSSPS